MRHRGFRGLVLVVSVVLAFGVFAAPRERPAQKFVKRVVRALGDLLTVPVPAPKPAQQP